MLRPPCDLLIVKAGYVSPPRPPGEALYLLFRAAADDDDAVAMAIGPRLEEYRGLDEGDTLRVGAANLLCPLILMLDERRVNDRI